MKVNEVNKTGQYDCGSSDRGELGQCEGRLMK